MIKIRKLFPKKALLSEIGYSLVEAPENKVVGKLVAMTQKHGKPKPKNVDEDHFNCQTNNLVVICHAEPLIRNGKKHQFLSATMNDHTWWLNTFSDKKAGSIVYLFCCYGYNAFYWQILRLIETLNLKVVSYHSPIQLGIGYPKLDRLTSSFFQRIREEVRIIDSADIFESKLKEEKLLLEKKLIKLISLADDKGLKSEANLLRIQLFNGFQSEYELGVH